MSWRVYGGLEDKIREDSLLRGPRWIEPVKVVRVEHHGKYITLSAVGLNSKQFYSEVLLPRDLDELEVLPEVQQPRTDEAQLLQASTLKLGSTFWWRQQRRRVSLTILQISQYLPLM